MSTIYSRPRMLGPREVEGVVSVDPFWQSAVLDISYLRAARTLIDQGPIEDLVMPIAYLQRHALEVALKDLVESAASLERGAGLLKNEAVPHERKVPWTHSLGEVKAALDEALAVHKIVLHSDFSEVIAFMHSSEIVDNKAFPDRWRYDTVRGGEKSFKTRTKIPIVQRQERLEKLFEVHLTVEDDYLLRDSKNVMEDLGQRHQWMGDALYVAGLL